MKQNLQGPRLVTPLHGIIRNLRGNTQRHDRVKVPTLAWREAAQMGQDLVEGPRRMHARHGPVFRVKVGPGLSPLLAVREPELVEQVLVKDRDKFGKGLVLQWLKTIFANSILVSEGEHWRKQRRIMAPSFTRRALADYAEIFVRRTDEALDRVVPGQTFELNTWTMALTLEIVLECLFGAEIDRARVKQVADALDDGLQHADAVIGGLFPPPPEWVPTASNRALKRAKPTMISIFDEIIAARRASGEERKDLLGLLLAARDEDGRGLTNEELREEVVTLLLAGHETTALNIAYTFMALGWDPSLVAAVRGELDEVVGDRVPGVADLPSLKLGEALLNESLRLYPPAGVISRRATEDTYVGDYFVPAYSQVMIPIRAIHYDPRWYPDPTRFDLSRWTEEEVAGRPRFSFMPFGGGQRICIGDRFAKMESQLVTARILQRFTPTTINSEPPPLKLTITMRPMEPILMRFDPR